MSGGRLGLRWKWWGQGLRAASAALVAALLATQPAVGAVRALTPSKDNTLFESATGSLSNGAGQHVFAGRTDVLAGAVIRRGLIAFDVAGEIPAGSTIVNASLTLNMSITNLAAGPRTVSLHRVLADWGEGTSDSLGGEGGGAASTPGDATWIHRFFSTTFWASSGGDFQAAPSASIVVNAVGFYTWGPTPSLVADVQGWLDAPGSNFGWILIGDESTFPTAKRFDSKDNPMPTFRPVLAVEFSVPGVPAGRIPDGDQVAGTALTVEHAAAGNITLDWDPSCLPGDTDFEIYEGTIGDFTGHVPRFCSTGAATTSTFLPAGGDTFYLVVPRNATREGSYGISSSGERPQGGVFTCFDQEIDACP